MKDKKSSNSEEKRPEAKPNDNPKKPNLDRLTYNIRWVQSNDDRLYW